MTNNGMPWVKLNCHLLDDPRFGRLPESVRVRYYDLLMLAGQCDAGGAFFDNGERLSDDEIAFKLKISVDEFLGSIEILKSVGYIILNGHGWQIARFEVEQGPSQEEKRRQWLERQNRHRCKDVTRDSPVSHASKSQSQSQDRESESESDKVNLSIESVIEQQDLTTDFSPTTVTMTKTELCKDLGFGGNHANAIIQDSEIGPEDILAEMCRNICRTGVGKGQVRNPRIITCLNLLKHEMPSAEWYDPNKWVVHLPQNILNRIAQPKMANTKLKVEEAVTFITEEKINPDETITQAIIDLWGETLKKCQEELPKAKFETWLDGAVPINYSQEGLLTISARNKYASEYLNDNMVAMITKIMNGTMKQIISIKFV